MKHTAATAYGLFFSLLACLLLTPGVAHAEADLGRMDLGSYVTGPKITNKDLRGRFVIVEYWGVNCGPCIGAIPHMTELAEEYGHKRLLIVANHCQNASDDKAKEVWEGRAKSNYVAVVNRGNLPGFNVTGIPAAIMFDPNGKEIWRGHPTSVDKPLEKAMRSFRWAKEEKEEEAAPVDPIVTGVEANHFKRQLDEINEQRRSIDSPLAQVRRFAERAPKEDQLAEAQAILAAVQQWAATRQGQINQSMTEDPAQSYDLTEKTIELLGRDELAKPFVEIKQKMESDKAMMDRVRSTRKLREVIDAAKAIGLTEKPEAAQDPKNSRDIRSITRDLGLIMKTWPDTDAAKQAETLLKDWGLQV